MRFILIGVLIAMIGILATKTPLSHPVGGTIPLGTIPQNRLLVLGDSLTSGLYATHEQSSFASLLAMMTGMQLARRNASNVTVATTVWNEVKVWEPSVIVLEIGLNDVSTGKPTDEQWLVSYKKLIADMKASGASVYACTMFWAGVPTIHPNYARYLKYNELIKQAAREEQVNLVDLWAATLNCTDCVSRVGQISYFAPHYHGDNFHPSDEGHRVIAQTIAGAFQKTLFIPFVIAN